MFWLQFWGSLHLSDCNIFSCCCQLQNSCATDLDKSLKFKDFTVVHKKSWTRRLSIPDIPALWQRLKCSPEVKYHYKLLHFVWEPASRRCCQRGVNLPEFVLKPQRGKEEVRGRLLGRRRRAERGQQQDSSVLPTGDKCLSPSTSYTRPWAYCIYSMYMIWRYTNTSTISRLSAEGLHRPHILSPSCTHTFFHTWTHSKMELNVARMACIRRWLCGESAWLSSEFTWLSKVVNPERQGRRGS